MMMMTIRDQAEWMSIGHVDYRSTYRLNKNCNDIKQHKIEVEKTSSQKSSLNSTSS